MTKNKELNSKQSSLRKLKMKYFWEQKFLEVSKFIGIIALVIGGVGFLPYWFGKLVDYLFPSFIKWLLESEVIGMFDYWVGGVFVLGSLFCIGLLLLVIYCQIEEWISSNLEKAEKRARLELKMNLKVASKLSSQRRMKGGEKK